MPSESTLLPSLLAQLRSPSSRSTTATASLTSSSADPDKDDDNDNDDDDDDETSSLEGLARRLNTARQANRRLDRSDSTSAAAAAAASSSSSSSLSTLHRLRQRRHAQDDNDDADMGAVKDDEEQADTDEDDDDDDDGQDRVQFVSRSEGHPDPRDLLRAQLSAANTAATSPSRIRRGDEVLLQSKQATEQDNSNRTRGVATSRRIVHDQQTSTASPTSSASKEAENDPSHSVSRQPGGSHASSVKVRVGAEGNSTSSDADAVTAPEATSMMMYLPRRYFILSTAGKLVYTSCVLFSPLSPSPSSLCRVRNLKQGHGAGWLVSRR